MRGVHIWHGYPSYWPQVNSKSSFDEIFHAFQPFLGSGLEDNRYNISRCYVEEESQMGHKNI